MDIQLKEKQCVVCGAESEEWPEWLTEGLEEAEIEALMCAAREEEAEPAEPVDWESQPGWISEGMEKPSEDELQAEQGCLAGGLKQTQLEVEATEPFVPFTTGQSQQTGPNLSVSETEGEKKKAKRGGGEQN